jgi:hypothetical protein
MTQFAKAVLFAVLSFGSPLVAQEIAAQVTSESGVGKSSTAAEVVAMATGSSAQSLVGFSSGSYRGPMAGGTRGADAASEVNESQVRRMFDPGVHHYRPHLLVHSPIRTLRPTTHRQRFVTWQMGYFSDGVRGAYFR